MAAKKLSMEIDAAIKSFRKTRAHIDSLRAPRESGVYGIYLCKPKALAPFSGNDDGLIYVGLSKNLAARDAEQHFTADQSGSSTLRRSLGAILKSDRNFRAISRAAAHSEKDATNYKFTPEDEASLTDWMRDNLEVGVYATRQYERVEGELIQQLKPLLNLTKCENPHRVEIKRLRKICADEARKGHEERPEQSNP